MEAENTEGSGANKPLGTLLMPVMSILELIMIVFMTIALPFQLLGEVFSGTAHGPAYYGY